MFLEEIVEGITYGDMVMAVLIALGLPLISYVLHLKEKRDEVDGRKVARITRYRLTFVLLWLPTILVLMLWLYAGREWSVIALHTPTDFPALVGWLAVLVLSVLLFAQIHLVRTKKGAADQLVAEIRNSPEIEDLLPHTSIEMRYFSALSLTAGITEEILFRGFLIWFFSHWLSVPAAAVLSLIFFMLAHLYQENLRAIIKVAVAGFVLTLVAVASGTLWPAIVLHFIIDLTSGLTARAALDTVSGDTSAA